MSVAEQMKATFGGYLKVDRNKNSLNKYNGIPTKKIFPHAKREGMMSILDRGIKEGDASKRDYAMGDGSVSMAFFDVDGNPITGSTASLNIGGMNFTPDANGRFHVIDEKWLDMESDLEFTRREYIGDIASKCVTDKIMAKVIGVTESQLKTLTQNEAKWPPETGMPYEVGKVDCTPSMVDSYVEDSAIWSMALSKIRFIISYYMPVLNKKTNTGEIDASDAIDGPPMRGGGGEGQAK